MKKIALILFCYTAQVLASATQPECPDARMFEIFVKNNTEAVCTVTQQILRRGYLEDIVHPLSLQPNEEKRMVKVQDFPFQGSDMVLSYQCGADKFVTIESEHDIWAGDSHYVKGWIWSVANMDAGFTFEHQSCPHNKPGKILWTLYSHAIPSNAKGSF